MKIFVVIIVVSLQACFGDVTHLPQNYLVTPQKTASKNIVQSDDSNISNNPNDPLQGFGNYPGFPITLPFGYNGIDEYSNFPNGLNTNNLGENFGIPSQQYQAFPPNYGAPQFPQENFQMPIQGFPNNGAGFVNQFYPQNPYGLQQGFGLGGSFQQPNLPQQNFPPQFLQQFPSQQGNLGLNGNVQQPSPIGYGNFPQNFDTNPSLRIASDTVYDTNGGYLYKKP